MDSVPSWSDRIERRAGPLYLAIADALAAAIRTGELQEGDRLPPQRQLAASLRVDLTTVTRAFNEARRRGLIEATVGRGSFVRTGAVGMGWRDDPRSVVDMTMNLPPVPEDLPLREMLHDGLKRLLRRSDISVLMSYRITAGAAEERAAGAAWLTPLLGRRDLDEVLVVPGAQAAMLAIATTVTRIGDTILAEKYAYPGIRALAAQLGLVLSGVAMDAGGMLPDALDRACASLRPRLIYCNPNLQNPTTATMSLERRRALLEVARRHDVMVLEDDAYGLLPETPVPALAQLAPGRVFHVATLAKSVSPGLRTAFLVAPSAELAPRLRSALRATSLMGPGLLTGLAAQWIREGQAAVILAGIRREIAARQAMATEILGGAPCASPAGPHIWLRLPDHWSSTEFVGYVRRQGLALVPSEVFTVEGEPPRRVRIALGAASGRESLRDALIATRAALQHKRPPGYGSIV